MWQLFDEMVKEQMIGTTEKLKRGWHEIPSLDVRDLKESER